MSSLWNRHGRRVLITSGIVVFSSPCFVMADAEKISQIGGVIIPQTFRVALQDGMSLPLFIHLESNTGTQDDQRIGSAFIWLDNGKVRLRQIRLEDKEQNATVSDQIRQTLTQMAH